MMILANEIEVLRGQIRQIVEVPSSLSLPEHFHFEKNVRETSNQARFVLEVLDEFDLKKYDYAVKKSIPLMKNVPNPECPQFSKIVFSEEQKSIKALLGEIVHHRHFHISNNAADGIYYLSVQSDLKSLCYVPYEDFLQSIKTFLIPINLIVCIICDKLKNMAKKVSNGDSVFDHFNYSTAGLFLWLFQYSFGHSVSLRLETMKTIFNISNIPDDISSQLAFSLGEVGHDGKIVIGFSPPWINGQNQISDRLDGALLFNLIRKHYNQKIA